MKIRLKGHETFALREGWLNKGLEQVQKDARVFSTNYGADALGVGSNMAKSIRYWLKAGDFIKESARRGAELTEIGSCVFENDRYLEDIFSLWIFHINLVWNMEKATSWYLFFNEIKLEEFSKEELFFAMQQRYAVYAEGKPVPERSIRDDISVLLHMYTREKNQHFDPEEKKVSPFAKLALFQRERDKYFRIQPAADAMDDAVVLYALMRYVHEKNTDAASIEELLQQPLSPGKVLNLKRVAFNEAIDHLAAMNYVTVNRTAGLDMVYINQDVEPQEIVRMYYKTHR